MNRSQQGNTLIIVVIALLAVATLGLAVLSAWAYSERSRYKEQTESIVAKAVEENTAEVRQKAAADFAEEAKKPLRPYVGPEAFGTVRFEYPKTWSLYDGGGSGSSELDIYGAPEIVPAAQNPASTFALRVQVVSSAYSDVLRTYQSQQKSGKVKIAPYSLPKTPGIVGSRLDGQLAPQKQGSMVVLPLRDKTLKMWTESDAGKADFDNIILPNTSFVP